MRQKWGRFFVGFMAAVAVLSYSSVRADDETEFLECFILKDRADALKRLIPGTADYYYYHALDAIVKKDLGSYERFMAEFRRQFERDGRIDKLDLRATVLLYEHDPAGAVRKIVERLNLHFNHVKSGDVGAARQYPSELDPEAVATDRLIEERMRDWRMLGRISQDGIAKVFARTSDEKVRETILRSHLTDPTVDGIVDALVDVMRKQKISFSDFAISRHLFLAQLAELAEKYKPVLEDASFVDAYLARLLAGENPTDDERDRQLERQLEFAATLSANFNTLKAQLLFEKLRRNLEKNALDEELFKSYLAFPRASWIVNPRLNMNVPHRQQVELRQQQQSNSAAGAVSDDVPLIRTYLERLFAGRDDYADYEGFLKADFLKKVFAEAKILSGNRDPKYVALLSEGEIKALKERVEIALAPDNPKVFGLGENVRLKLSLKNVPELIVRVYRINAYNYYRTHKREIDGNFDVMGLKADFETVIERQMSETTRFDCTIDALAEAMRDPGVYVVDFLGNGKNARAVISRGRLSLIDETVSDGMQLTVFDHDRRTVEGAKIYIDGHEYTTDADGRVRIPFAGKESHQAAMLKKGELCSLDFFTHRAAGYRLLGGIFVDRQSLLARTRAKVIVSPRLLSHGTPVSVTKLSDVKFGIVAVDRNGVATTQVVDDIRLSDEDDYVHEFTVPQYLAHVRFTLSGKIAVAWQDEKQELNASETVVVGPADEPLTIGMPYLVRGEKGYRLMVLGKNGEPLVGEAVNLQFTNRFVTDTIHRTLQTDDAGSVFLGRLPDVVSFRAQVAGSGLGRAFDLRESAPILPERVFVHAGEAIELGFQTGGAGDGDFRLYRVIRGWNVENVSANVKILDQKIRIDGLEPGSYVFIAGGKSVEIRTFVTTGKVEKKSWLLVGEKSVMHSVPLSRLAIDEIAEDGETVRIRLAGFGAGTRVHVIGRYFAVNESPLDAFRENYELATWEKFFPRVENNYLAARDLGFEYRYILARKRAKKYPGNLLERPWLILNPVETGGMFDVTGTGGESGGGFGQRGQGGRETRVRGGGGGRRTESPGALPWYEFLKDPSVVLANLKPDDKGEIVIERAKFENAAAITVTALDPHHAVEATKPLSSDRSPATADLRLDRMLDAEKVFGQQTLARAVKSGEVLKFRDKTSTDFLAVSTLGDLFLVLKALNPSIDLDHFEYLTRWHRLGADEKLAMYSRDACHELNVFLKYKDPQFFREVVKPYLGNKLHREFVDEWLADGDLRRFAADAERRRLNVFEKILLEKALDASPDATARWVSDHYDLSRLPDERIERLIDTVLGSRGLEKPGTARKMADRLPPHAPGTLAAKMKEERDDEETVIGDSIPAEAFADAEKGRRAQKAMRNKADEKAETKIGYFAEDAAVATIAENGKAARRFFRNIDKTKEYAEMAYFCRDRALDQQARSLVPANPFWADFAQNGAEPLLSANVYFAHSTLAEALLALAVSGLAFEADKPDEKVDGATLALAVKSDAIVFSREIAPIDGKAAADAAPIMVSMRHFPVDPGREYRPDEERKPVGEFLPTRAYYADITVTNPTPLVRKCDVLYQIPVGAIAFNQKENVKNLKLTLQPYGTYNHRFMFYFPNVGDFKQYPARVYVKDDLLASTGVKDMAVVAQLTKIDRKSWDWVALNGSDDDVIGFLENANVGRIHLDKVFYRLKDREFYTRLTALLSKRGFYNPTVCSYAFHHGDADGMRGYIKRSWIADRIGGYMTSTLLTLDPVRDGTYRHLEYAPLVVARTHAMKGEKTIFIEGLGRQYAALLENLTTAEKPDDSQLMELAYYFLLQNRIDEAVELVGRVNKNDLEIRLQYAYFNCYLNFFLERLDDARSIAEEYRDYPVLRWRNRFREVLSQVAEAAGGGRLAEGDSRESKLAEMSGGETAIDFRVEGHLLKVAYDNVTEFRMNVYEMDVEVLFSRNPFARDYAERFAFVRPSLTTAVATAEKSGRMETEIPAEYRNRDVFVELSAGGVSKSALALSANLDVKLYPNTGRLRVADRADGKALPRVYVKVYAMIDGQAEFYKDGYTDLRGVFDYATVSDGKLDRAKNFAILVLSETQGSVILEAQPPKQ